jgi:hypothetical protein
VGTNTCTSCGHEPTRIEVAGDGEVFKFCAWGCCMDFVSQVVRRKP